MRLGAVLAAAALVAGSAAGAATLGAVTLNVQQFADRSQLDAAQQAMSDYLAGRSVKAVETFNGFDAWNGTDGTANPTTSVGRFEGFGSRGTGGAAVSDGRSAEVRGDEMCCGRYNTDMFGDNWLDSNDMTGLRWTVEGLGMFDTVAFLLTDVADVGARFSMSLGGETFADLAGLGGRLANGNLMLVMIELSDAVESLTVEMFNNRTNDGFGIDGATVASGLAPIPLPPAAALLFAGLAALVGVRRRRAAA